MSLFDALAWTSRAAACASLVDSLEHAASPVSRSSAAKLFSILATPDDEPVLRRLLLDVAEEKWVRTFALRALVRLDASLSLPELRQLLNKAVADEAEGTPRPFDFEWLLQLLGLARTPEEVRLATDSLKRLSAVANAVFIRFERGRSNSAAREIKEASYRRWLETDRPTLGVSSELEVAIDTLQHPESRAILLDRWGDLSFEQNSAALFRMARSPESHDAFAPGTRPWRDAADAFLLPIDDLVDAYGEDRLRGIFVEGVKRNKQDGVNPPCVGRLLPWIAASLHTTELAFALMEDRRVPLYERKSAAFLLLAQDRARVGAWALEQLERDSDLSLACRIVEELARVPTTSDRALLFRAMSSRESPQARYLGIQGIDTLGEPPTQLHEFLTTDPNWFVRLRAHAAIAQGGDRASLKPLVEAAWTAPDVHVRAEALSWLGDLAPEAHVPLFKEALFHEVSNGDAFDTPAAEEAALALAKLGSPQALTLLLRAFLFAPNYVGDGIEEHIEVHLARERGLAMLIREPGFMWRGSRPHNPWWRQEERVDDWCSRTGRRRH